MSIQSQAHNSIQALAQSAHAVALASAQLKDHRERVERLRNERGVPGQSGARYSYVTTRETGAAPKLAGPEFDAAARQEKVLEQALNQAQDQLRQAREAVAGLIGQFRQEERDYSYNTAVSRSAVSGLAAPGARDQIEKQAAEGARQTVLRTNLISRLEQAIRQSQLCEGSAPARSLDGIVETSTDESVSPFRERTGGGIAAYLDGSHWINVHFGRYRGQLEALDHRNREELERELEEVRRQERAMAQSHYASMRYSRTRRSLPGLYLGYQPYDPDTPQGQQDSKSSWPSYWV